MIIYSRAIFAAAVVAVVVVVVAVVVVVVVVVERQNRYNRRHNLFANFSADYIFPMQYSLLFYFSVRSSAGACARVCMCVTILFFVAVLFYAVIELSLQSS